MSDDCGTNPCVCGQASTDQCDGTHKRYATESPAVGGERMSDDYCVTRCTNALGWSKAKRKECRSRTSCQEYDAYATSLERKPLDGYDWRADFNTLVVPDGLDDSEVTEARDRLAAYIEALEAR
jgi:hypothetical protein